SLMPWALQNSGILSARRGVGGGGGSVLKLVPALGVQPVTGLRAIVLLHFGIVLYMSAARSRGSHGLLANAYSYWFYRQPPTCDRDSRLDLSGEFETACWRLPTKSVGSSLQNQLAAPYKNFFGLPFLQCLALSPITSHRTSATTLSAAGAGSA